eukprot:TRINITY_DN40237_c0_g1_i1.p1 TRINITY_DN40237_c0_g1~~TRINITY_DN40237_c0_g1_i1.p1  ORF type:complete len:151 (+),score=55.61 TRINITY_DN40237_c0_g1_i1:36-455(+)
MEVAVAKYLATVKSALIVVDCLEDMTAAEITANTAPLVQYFRNNGHPKTPILLVAGTVGGDEWINSAPASAKRAALQQQYNAIKSTDPNTHLFANSENELYRKDYLVSPTTGGIDPTDLGHKEMAHFYTSYLQQFLPDS